MGSNIQTVDKVKCTQTLQTICQSPPRQNKMDCLQSSQQITSPILTSTFQQKQKQNLVLTDYQAFLLKSKQEGRTDYPSTFTFIKLDPISDQALNQIPYEDISPLQCSRLQLINLAVSMVMENNFAQSKFDEGDVRQLFTEIGENYNSISYHNFSHGFSLMQMLYKCFKMDQRLHTLYTDQELTYYLVAGLTHDVNHSTIFVILEGNNNAFEVKMATELAKTAQNDAVLERMHSSTFFKLCKNNQKNDIVSKSSNPLLTKQKITRVILSTDMARHFKNLAKIQQPRLSGSLDLTNEQNKIIYMENLVHACDIGNSLLSFDEYLNWGSLLTYQFNEQAKLEAKNNIPVMEFLKYKGFISFYDDQVGFLSKFVIPLWKQIALTFTQISPMIINAQGNLHKIEQLKQKQNS